MLELKTVCPLHVTSMDWPYLGTWWTFYMKMLKAEWKVNQQEAEKNSSATRFGKMMVVFWIKRAAEDRELWRQKGRQRRAVQQKTTDDDFVLLCQLRSFKVKPFRTNYGVLPENSTLLRSHKVIGTDMDRSATYDFLLVLHGITMCRPRTVFYIKGNIC